MMTHFSIGFKKFFNLLNKITPLAFRKIKLNEIGEQISSNSSKPEAVLLYFNHWKKEFIGDYFPEYKLFFLKKSYYKTTIFNWLIKQDINIIIWGYKDYLKEKSLFEKSMRVIRVEDGFLRSFDLGQKKTKPLSLVVDFTGLYYNSTRTSDLENLLNYYDFSSHEIHEAKRAIALIKEHGVSKYNHAPKLDLNAVIGTKKKKRILVIGQVEKDASIRYGCNRSFTNIDLVKLAYQENPTCEIIYKIHPDILDSMQPMDLILDEITTICTIISADIAPASLFAEVDQVYTITSLMGFEALMYGLPVVCVEAPFYSNWGLTDDRQLLSRRIRKRSLEEIFYAAYILYPRYPYGNILTIISQLSHSNLLEEVW